MNISIRISKTIYNEAKKAARAERRSISNQIAFWAMIGKCALDNPDLPVEFIKEILVSKRQALVEPFKAEPFN